MTTGKSSRIECAVKARIQNTIYAINFETTAITEYPKLVILRKIQTESK